ncbi:DUF4124 domain-containing protein [Propionivibrio dicarboxylicus]|uniref:Glutaredoxin n=1 Tax=Propionivibrio dicarboxylicus TaxID=83767 RepID=A0A1G8FC61_9RHOO|nr:DUF4124 domain-containing protein [Propionivibrio dicarboxylicus]SDH79710.1 Glutaredoxin [Propionivibrio dicarboxylicus]
MSRRTLTIVQLLLLTAVLSAANSQAQTLYRWIDRTSGQTVFSDRPPPPGSTAAEVKSEAKASADEAPLPYAVRLAAERFPVTLYTLSRCLEPCRLARDLLNGRGVPFTESLADTAEEQDALAARLGGDIAIPSLFVGTQGFRGFEATAWHNLLDLAGYPASAPYGAKPSGIFKQ